MKKKSVQSINQWQSPDYLGAGVIQTSYDVVKAHGGEIKVKSGHVDKAGTIFSIILPMTIS